jgi:hypothetical protein
VEVAAPKATVSAPAPTGDTEQDGFAAAWHKVVVELSALSNVASQRLAKSRIRGKLASGSVVVEFERQSDAEWVQEGAKIRKAVQEAWYKHSGEEKELKFEVQKTNGARPQTAETTTVELPAEGETLEKLGREVFGPGATETGER